MATAEVLPAESAGRDEFGSHRLTAAELPVSNIGTDVSAKDVADEWLSSFQKVLDSSNYEGLRKLFLQESYWRDQLCLTWNFHTLQNPDNIVDFVKNHPKGCRLKSLKTDASSDIRKPAVAPIDFLGDVKGINAFLQVETDVGRGRGFVRLCRDANDGTWKAFTLFTAMEELKGFEENTGPRRPDGVEHGGKADRKNWLDRRIMEENFEGGAEPTILIIGAGQGGLTAAARLKQLGVSTLIVERNKRIGDNWRNRYHQLVLHDPVWYDHLPYLPFPNFWPKFTPKDKLGDWFESYASALELNVWLQTSFKDLSWSDETKSWTITLDRIRDGRTESRTLHPRFVIQATGHSGEKNFPSSLQGMKDFKGDVLCHSSEFEGAKPNSKGKRAIVVGCCNSGHDIAQDFYEKGYDVTIVQRSSTYVISSKNVLDVLLAGLYDENGPPTEDADLLFMSIPNAVVKRVHVDATKEVARRDQQLLDGLTKAGFKLDNGPDDSGFFMKYFQRGGGYYIDVGCSQLIADRKIKVKQGQEVTRVNAHSLTFADGDELPADEIVFATGYSNMRETSRRIFGGEVADRANDIWGFDPEGELRTIWRRTGHPGLWYMGGNLGLSRWYSRMLALQLKGLIEGLWSYDDL